MRRALRRAVGVLLATGVVGLARPAMAQTSSYLLQSQQTPVRTVPYNERAVLSDGRARLEEMKVQLTLLSDSVTFPYYLGTRACGGKLEVSGEVPNDLVKQRALDLARHSTALSVTDGLKIQANLRPRPSLTAVESLQREGGELLANTFGEVGRQIRIEAQLNGLVTIHGSINSVEEKMVISQLLRQLPGCSGVVNQLTVQRILRDGQNIVRVTKDGAQTVPLSALETDPEQVVSAPTAAVPKAENLAPVLATLPAPQPMLPRNLDAQKAELALPNVVPAKPISGQPAPSPTTSDQTVYPTIKLAKATKTDGAGWEAVPVPSVGGSTPEAANAPMTPKPSPNGVRSAISWENDIRTNAEAKSATTPVAPATEKMIKPAGTHRACGFASDALFSRSPTPASADALKAPAPPTQWDRPVSWQPQHPANLTPKPTTTLVRATSVAPQAPATQPAILASSVRPPETSVKRTAAPSMPTDATALRSARRWPPAYEVRPPESNKGRPGVIRFEDEPTPAHATHQATTGAVSPIVLADLQRKVRAVCGRQAQDVLVEVQRDGGVLVRVLVANPSAEQKLPSKIMTIPEMAAPNIRLETVCDGN